MIFNSDIIIDEGAFLTASEEMQSLAVRTQELKEKMEKMYDDLTSALQTPAGEQLEFTAEDVLIKPINDLKLVVDHIASVLSQIIDSGYYKDIFVKYEEVNGNIKVN